MSLLSKLLGTQTTEYIFQKKTWQERAREEIQNENQALEIIRDIPKISMSTEEKMEAMDVMKVACHSKNLTWQEKKRLQHEQFIENERIAAQAGNISWQEFERYEREERAWIAKNC